jgi:alpha-galactosidase
MIHHLRAAGVSVVLDARGPEVPVVLHWGRDLGPLTGDELAALAEASVPAVPPSSIDEPLRVGVVPLLSHGWSGHPPFVIDPAPTTRRFAGSVRDGDAVVLTLFLDDVEVHTRFELMPQGVLTVGHAVRNTGDGPIGLGAASVALPVPARAAEVLDFAGRWAAERRPQRLHPGHGVWLRETRHGRGGHDDPFLMVAGTPGFGFCTGEVWTTHVAWSGDKTQWFERSELGPSVLGAGERIERRVLAPGEEYVSPVVVAVWSDAGLDGVSDRVHPWVRSWSTISRPRPVTLNTWEAVYFDQSFERLEPLVRAAADVGVERFVLDDGWFLGRRDDKRALGDWEVDPQAWPEGLDPLIRAVHDAGMEFGLWVEPEMVSADSDLARAHPEWLLTSTDAPTWRWQHVLDLARDDVREHLFARLDALLTRYPIASLKWDHNRDLLVADSGRQVRALYRLIDDLRAAHPDVEIESCASGGGRIDLGILRRVDRVWTSDTNDPVLRQRIQRFTGILIPPEYLGAHIGDERAHTTGRTATLAFRLATAFFPHAGIESDLTRLSPGHLRAVRTFTSVHRRFRDLLHTGRIVRSDSADDAVVVHGVVAADAREAVYAYAVLDIIDTALPAPLRLEGLDPDRRYRVARLDLGSTPPAIQDAAPPWLQEGMTLPGSALAEGVLQMPLLAPGNAILFHVTEADGGSDRTTAEPTSAQGNSLEENTGETA